MTIRDKLNQAFVSAPTLQDFEQAAARTSDLVRRINAASNLVIHDPDQMEVINELVAEVEDYLPTSILPEREKEAILKNVRLVAELASTYVPEGVVPQKKIVKTNAVRSKLRTAFTASEERLSGSVADASEPATTVNYADAPRDPAARTVDTVYKTPKGLLKWTGAGWIDPHG
jgi:hypothetical protein